MSSADCRIAGRCSSPVSVIYARFLESRLFARFFIISTPWPLWLAFTPLRQIAHAASRLLLSLLRLMTIIITLGRRL